MSEQEIVRSTRGLKNRKRKFNAGLMKKVTICLASIICCLSFVAVGVLASLTDIPVEIDNDVYYYATAFNKNDSDEFIIETYEDLVMMSNLVNNGVKIPDTDISYQDAKYIVAKDIDPKKSETDANIYSLTPIGTSSNPFRGVFNGGGHTISNVTIAQGTGVYYVGLFGVTEGADIYSIGIGTVASPTSCTYNFTVGSDVSMFNAGGIVGYAKANTEGTPTSVHDCYNYSDITVSVSENINSVNVGGIVGNAENATIINCYNTGNITLKTSTGSVASINSTTSASGIAYCSDSSLISYCYSIGTIKSVEYNGTFYGSAIASSSVVPQNPQVVNFALSGCLSSSLTTTLERYNNVNFRTIENMADQDALTSETKMYGLNTSEDILNGTEHYKATKNQETEAGNYFKLPQLSVFCLRHDELVDNNNYTEDWKHHYSVPMYWELILDLDGGDFISEDALSNYCNGGFGINGDEPIIGTSSSGTKTYTFHVNGALTGVPDYTYISKPNNESVGYIFSGFKVVGSETNSANTTLLQTENGFVIGVNEGATGKIYLKAYYTEVVVSNNTIDGEEITNKTLTYGDSVTLSTEETATLDGSKVYNINYTYAWYECDESGNIISSVLSASQSYTSTLNFVGTKYYICVITATKNDTPNAGAQTTINSKTFTITAEKRNIYILTQSAEKTYDGTALTNNTFIVKESKESTNVYPTGTAGVEFTSAPPLATGDKLTLQMPASIINVGTIENTIDSIIIKNAGGENVTEYYQILQEYGSLEVTQAQLATPTIIGWSTTASDNTENIIASAIFKDVAGIGAVDVDHYDLTLVNNSTSNTYVITIPSLTATGTTTYEYNSTQYTITINRDLETGHYAVALSDLISAIGEGKYSFTVKAVPKNEDDKNRILVEGVYDDYHNVIESAVANSTDVTAGYLATITYELDGSSSSAYISQTGTIRKFFVLGNYIAEMGFKTATGYQFNEISYTVGTGSPVSLEATNNYFVFAKSANEFYETLSLKNNNDSTISPNNTFNDYIKITLTSIVTHYTITFEDYYNWNTDAETTFRNANSSNFTSDSQMTYTITDYFDFPKYTDIFRNNTYINSEKSGYIFIGWVLKSNAGNQNLTTQEEITGTQFLKRLGAGSYGNFTITAVWSIISLPDIPNIEITYGGENSEIRTEVRVSYANEQITLTYEWSIYDFFSESLIWSWEGEPNLEIYSTNSVGSVYYKVKVIAKRTGTDGNSNPYINNGASVELESDLIEVTINQATLEAPTNLVWTSDIDTAIANFNGVDGIGEVAVDSYIISLYRYFNGSTAKVGDYAITASDSNSKATAYSYDFTSIISATGEGNYYFTVKAVASETNNSSYSNVAQYGTEAKSASDTNIENGNGVGFMYTVHYTYNASHINSEESSGMLYIMGGAEYSIEAMYYTKLGYEITSVDITMNGATYTKQENDFISFDPVANSSTLVIIILNEHITGYTHFTINTSPITYNIIFNLNGAEWAEGSVVGEEDADGNYVLEYNVNSAIEFPNYTKINFATNTTSHKAYIFIGWKIDTPSDAQVPNIDGGNGLVYSAEEVASGVTYNLATSLRSGSYGQDIVLIAQFVEVTATISDVTFVYGTTDKAISSTISAKIYGTNTDATNIGFTYAWYSSNSDATEKNIISGSTSSSYALASILDAGTYYYILEVTATRSAGSTLVNDGASVTEFTNVATVTVTQATLSAPTKVYFDNILDGANYTGVANGIVIWDEVPSIGNVNIAGYKVCLYINSTQTLVKTYNVSSTTTSIDLTQDYQFLSNTAYYVVVSAIASEENNAGFINVKEEGSTKSTKSITTADKTTIGYNTNYNGIMYVATVVIDEQLNVVNNIYNSSLSNSTTKVFFALSGYNITPTFNTNKGYKIDSVKIDSTTIGTTVSSSTPYYSVSTTNYIDTINVYTISITSPIQIDITTKVRGIDLSNFFHTQLNTNVCSSIGSNAVVVTYIEDGVQKTYTTNCPTHDTLDIPYGTELTITLSTKTANGFRALGFYDSQTGATAINNGTETLTGTVSINEDYTAIVVISGNNYTSIYGRFSTLSLPVYTSFYSQVNQNDASLKGGYITLSGGANFTGTNGSTATMSIISGSASSKNSSMLPLVIASATTKNLVSTENMLWLKAYSSLNVNIEANVGFKVMGYYPAYNTTTAILTGTSALNGQAVVPCIVIGANVYEISYGEYTDGSTIYHEYVTIDETSYGVSYDEDGTAFVTIDSTAYQVVGVFKYNDTLYTQVYARITPNNVYISRFVHTQYNTQDNLDTLYHGSLGGYIEISGIYFDDNGDPVNITTDTLSKCSNTEDTAVANFDDLMLVAYGTEVKITAKTLSADHTFTGFYKGSESTSEKIVIGNNEVSLTGTVGYRVDEANSSVFHYTFNFEDSNGSYSAYMYNDTSGTQHKWRVWARFEIGATTLTDAINTEVIYNGTYTLSGKGGYAGVTWTTPSGAKHELQTNKDPSTGLIDSKTCYPITITAYEGMIIEISAVTNFGYTFAGFFSAKDSITRIDAGDASTTTAKFLLKDAALHYEDPNSGTYSETGYTEIWLGFTPHTYNVKYNKNTVDAYGNPLVGNSYIIDSEGNIVASTSSNPVSGTYVTSNLNADTSAEFVYGKSGTLRKNVKSVQLNTDENGISTPQIYQATSLTTGAVNWFFMNDNYTSGTPTSGYFIAEMVEVEVDGVPTYTWTPTYIFYGWHTSPSLGWTESNTTANPIYKAKWKADGTSNGFTNTGAKNTYYPRNYLYPGTDGGTRQLYAIWVPVGDTNSGISLKVDLHGKNGEEYLQDTGVIYGQSLSLGDLLTNADANVTGFSTNEGYTLAGWSVNANTDINYGTTQSVILSNYSASQDVTVGNVNNENMINGVLGLVYPDADGIIHLYAVWKREITYHVGFESGGNTSTNTYTTATYYNYLTTGNAYVYLPNALYSGFDFAGVIACTDDAHTDMATTISSLTDESLIKPSTNAEGEVGIIMSASMLNADGTGTFDCIFKRSLTVNYASGYEYDTVTNTSILTTATRTYNKYFFYCGSDTEIVIDDDLKPANAGITLAGFTTLNNLPQPGAENTPKFLATGDSVNKIVLTTNTLTIYAVYRGTVTLNMYYTYQLVVFAGNSFRRINAGVKLSNGNIYYTGDSLFTATRYFPYNNLEMAYNMYTIEGLYSSYNDRLSTGFIYSGWSYCTANESGGFDENLYVDIKNGGGITLPIAYTITINPLLVNRQTLFDNSELMDGDTILAYMMELNSSFLLQNFNYLTSGGENRFRVDDDSSGKFILTSITADGQSCIQFTIKNVSEVTQYIILKTTSTGGSAIYYFNGNTANSQTLSGNVNTGIGINSGESITLTVAYSPSAIGDEFSVIYQFSTSATDTSGTALLTRPYHFASGNIGETFCYLPCYTTAGISAGAVVTGYTLLPYRLAKIDSNVFEQCNLEGFSKNESGYFEATYSLQEYIVYYINLFTLTDNNGREMLCDLVDSQDFYIVPFATTVNANSVNFDASTNGGNVNGSLQAFFQNGSGSLYIDPSLTSILTPVTASKTSHTFIGWFTSSTGGEMVISPDGTLSANVSGYTSNGVFATSGSIILYAQFTENISVASLYLYQGSSNLVTVIYAKYGVGFYSDAECTTSIVRITVPSRPGYIFEGFYCPELGNIIDSDGYITISNISITSNVNAYGIWSTDMATVVLSATSAGATIQNLPTVTAFVQSGGISSSLFTSQELVNALSLSMMTPKKSEAIFGNIYTFLGWYTGLNDGELVISPDGTLTTQSISGIAENGKWVIPNSTTLTLYPHFQSTVLNTFTIRIVVPEGVDTVTVTFFNDEYSGGEQVDSRTISSTGGDYTLTVPAYEDGRFIISASLTDTNLYLIKYWKYVNSNTIGGTTTSSTENYSNPLTILSQAIESGDSRAVTATLNVTKMVASVWLYKGKATGSTDQYYDEANAIYFDSFAAAVNYVRNENNSVWVDSTHLGGAQINLLCDTTESENMVINTVPEASYSYIAKDNYRMIINGNGHTVTFTGTGNALEVWEPILYIYDIKIVHTGTGNAFYVTNKHTSDAFWLKGGGSELGSVKRNFAWNCTFESNGPAVVTCKNIGAKNHFDANTIPRVNESPTFAEKKAEAGDFPAEDLYHVSLSHYNFAGYYGAVKIESIQFIFATCKIISHNSSTDSCGLLIDDARVWVSALGTGTNQNPQCVCDTTNFYKTTPSEFWGSMKYAVVVRNNGFYECGDPRTKYEVGFSAGTVVSDRVAIKIESVPQYDGYYTPILMFGHPIKTTVGINNEITIKYSGEITEGMTFVDTLKYPAYRTRYGTIPEQSAEWAQYLRLVDTSMQLVGGEDIYIRAYSTVSTFNVQSEGDNSTITESGIISINLIQLSGDNLEVATNVYLAELQFLIPNDIEGLVYSINHNRKINGTFDNVFMSISVKQIASAGGADLPITITATNMNAVQQSDLNTALQGQYVSDNYKKYYWLNNTTDSATPTITISW